MALFVKSPSLVLKVMGIDTRLFCGKTYEARELFVQGSFPAEIHHRTDTIITCSEIILSIMSD